MMFGVNFMRKKKNTNGSKYKFYSEKNIECMCLCVCCKIVMENFIDIPID